MSSNSHPATRAQMRDFNDRQNAKRAKQAAQPDDDDMGDLFRALRKHQQEKRHENKEKSTSILTERGVPFTSHNAGVHLVVASKWDFWPSTGKFAERRGIAGKPLRKGRGVFNLLDIIERDARGSTTL